ncbi:MAG: oligoendopeptidase F family protein, partial [Acidobacteriota bacterium]|nr:oligoendopeptidase F family protein [Acidobacteriota bacterium]
MRTPLLFLAVLFTAVAAWPLAGQERDRSQVPPEFTWNLADIYPTEAAWRAAKDRLAAELSTLRQFEGKLRSATTLADALDRAYALNKELARTYVYASMLADQDTRASGPQGMQQEMTQLAAAFSAQTSFMEPEILRFETGTVDRFIAAEPRLETYAFYLRDIVRRGEHTLTDKEESLLASAGPVAGVPQEAYTILTNADLPYPTVTLSDGTPVVVNQANFTAYRGAPNRADREAVMAAFFKTLGGFGRTFGVTMNGEVQKVQFFAKARRYATPLEFALDGPHIPVSVYTRLVDGVNANLSTFHRYLSLRKRMMGLDDLHYYDLYAPLVGSVNLAYTPEEAQRHILEATAPLGAEYAATLKRAFTERWIDLFPTPGKRSGAYSNGGAYDVHPYMLVNYNGQYTDMSTLAHELGHTMHSFFSNKTQPYAKADYPIFVAEVASTFNESLLIDHMLTSIADDDARLALLGNYLENIKGTVFRQTQFAEFELRMH